jgi:hypothetical protein
VWVAANWLEAAAYALLAAYGVAVFGQQLHAHPLRISLGGTVASSVTIRHGVISGLSSSCAMSFIGCAKGYPLPGHDTRLGVQYLIESEVIHGGQRSPGPPKYPTPCLRSNSRRILCLSVALTITGGGTFSWWVAENGEGARERRSSGK